MGSRRRQRGYGRAGHERGPGPGGANCAEEGAKEGKGQSVGPVARGASLSHRPGRIGAAKGQREAGHGF